MSRLIRPVRGLVLTAAMVGGLAMTSAARAELLDRTVIGSWRGGALTKDGVVTQCVLASPVAATPPGGAFAAFQSISRASGFAFAVDDKAMPQELGHQVEVSMAIDGRPVDGVDGKAVGPTVVAAYPKQAGGLKSQLAAGHSISFGYAGVTHVIALTDEPKILGWLDDCARTHGLGNASFDQGRAEEEKKLGN